MRMAIKKKIFTACFLLCASLILRAQEKNAFAASLNLIDADEKIIQGGVLYEGQTIKGVISFDEKKWDGKTKFYCYVFQYTEGENILNLFYPLGDIDNQFPIRLPDGSYQKRVNLFEGVISPPFGLDNFILVMSEKPIPNYRDIARNSGTRGTSDNSKRELMKLLKGSKLSEFYDPGYGKFATNTLQVESRPLSEKAGLTKGNTARSVFIMNDSAEIFYTPVPQTAIVRDSFPIIEITDPFFDTVSTRGTKILSAVPSKKILIRGITVDRKSGIKRVLVNDQPVTSYRETVGYFDYLYELNDGVNTADITVENNNGYKRLVRIRFQYNAPKQEVVSIPKDILLVIGIDNYVNGWPTLNNAKRDAKDFEDLMTGQYGYKKENTIELFNGNATNRNIFNTIDSLARNLNSNDRLLVYFSGHGYYDKQMDMGYWIPSNAEKNASYEYIDNLRLTRLFSKAKVKNIFIIVDACYSGQFVRDMRREDAGNDKSRMVLCSGKLQPVSDGDPGKNSPFAEKVLAFFRKPTATPLLASDLIYSVKNSFSQLDGQKPVGGAIDEVGDENGDFVFQKKK